jgi:hypothetical protein
LWVKFDQDGNQIWDLTWYGDNFIHGMAGQTIQDTWGNFYSAGNDGFQDMPNTACLFKFSPSGIPLKKTNLFNTISSCAQGIAFFADSTLFMGGAAGNTIGQDYDQYFALKCDTIGNIIKTKLLPLFGSNMALAVVSTDNKIYDLSERIVNNGYWHWETCLFKFNQDLEYDSIYTQPRVYDSLCPHAVAPNQSISLDCVMVDTDEPLLTDLDQNLKLYPNPASDLLTVALPNKVTILDNRNHIKTTTTYYTLQTNKMIQLVNVSGQVLQSVVIAAGQNTAILDVSNLPSGMYLVRVLHRNQIWLNGKVMVGR